MNTNNTTSNSGGIGSLHLLTIVFITLKLCHVIDWSWWWVLAPIWINIVATIGILLLVFIYSLIFERRKQKGSL